MTGKERTDMAKEQSLMPTDEPLHMQAEWPAAGTALNPAEGSWAFDDNAAAVPEDRLAGAMYQGE
jgi:hypothetical protein